MPLAPFVRGAFSRGRFLREAFLFSSTRSLSLSDFFGLLRPGRLGSLPLFPLLVRSAFDVGRSARLAFLIRSARCLRLGRVATPARFQDRNERTGQFLDVGLKSRRRNLDPLPPRQTLQAIRQFARLGHHPPIDKDGNDANVPLERSLNLDPDKIIRIVEATPIVFVCARNPVPSDDRHKRVASADAIREDVEPINTKIDVIDIKEDVFALQPLHHAIMDRTRGERRLFPPIANADFPSDSK